MTPTEIGINPKATWRALLIAIIALGVLYFWLGYMPIFGWIAGIGILIAFVFRLITGEGKGPVIVLNDEGVFDKRLRVGVIRWEDIRRIKSHSLQGAMYISLELHDQKKYEARRPFWLTLLSQAQRLQAMSPTSISTNGLNIDHQTLVNMIHEGCQEVSQRNVEGVQA